MQVMAEKIQEIRTMVSKKEIAAHHIKVGSYLENSRL
jgi:hypothetical protein